MGFRGGLSEVLGDVGTHQGNGDDGIVEHVRSWFREEAAEVVVLVGLFGEEHGGSDGDGARCGGEWQFLEGVGDGECVC